MCALIRPPLLTSFGRSDDDIACAVPVDFDMLMFHLDNNVCVVRKYIEKFTSVAATKTTGFYNVANFSLNLSLLVKEYVFSYFLPASLPIPREQKSEKSTMVGYQGFQ